MSYGFSIKFHTLSSDAKILKIRLGQKRSTLLSLYNCILQLR